jgi:hypothetical protein
MPLVISTLALPRLHSAILLLGTLHRMALLCLVRHLQPIDVNDANPTPIAPRPCQETDYPAHKLLFTRFAPDTRPSVNHRRAIYAAVNEPDAPGWDGHDEPHLDQLLKLAAGETGYRTTPDIYPGE